MKISLNWLSRYIDIKNLKPEQLSETLTDLGLEVEGIESVQSLHDNVVTGKIISAKPHPDAEKLQICEVDVGTGNPLTIVCGAPNARKDLTVAVAQIGSVLPGDFKIKPSKIRGEKSEGMLCSDKELGLGSGDDGIMELDAKIKIGTKLVDHYGLKDTVLEIGLTPNRSDCLGYLGLARDLSAKLQRPLLKPKIPENYGDSSVKTASKLEIKLQSNDDCGRFVALLIDQVQTIASPLWLQKQLENSGMRPINLIVDATNYIMLETGQPIHAYDIRDIKGAMIQVRRATDGEALTTLDQQKRTLNSEDIVIADGEKAIGLAGVMGGANSEVKDDTSTIIIEVANFNPRLVRKTSKRYSIFSEASHRFERGVDVTQAAYVAQRVAQVITEGMTEQGLTQKPIIAGSFIDHFPAPPIPAKIALRTDRVRQITGIRSLTQTDCIQYLERLGFSYLDKAEERALFEVPSWRLDIVREADLIEEIARLHGYKHIPNTLPMMEIGGIKEKPLINFTDECKYTLAGQGFSEVISFPYISGKDLDDLNLSNQHPFRQIVELMNPLAEDQCYLRTTVMTGLLKALVNNRKHGTKGTRLFEAARNFYRIEGSESADKLGIWKHLSTNGSHIIGKARQDKRPIERNIIAGVIDQPYSQKTWQKGEEKATYFHGKESVNDLLAAMGVKDVEYMAVAEQEIPWLHPGASAAIYYKQHLLGYVGELHPKTTQCFDLDIDQAPIVFELDLEFILLASRETASYLGSSIKFPPVTRDFAFVVDKSVSHKNFLDAFGTFNRRKNLSAYRLFDVYEGERLTEGKKSLAFNLVFQSDKKSLTDKEVEKEVEALVDWFKTQLSAELR